MSLEDVYTKKRKEATLPQMENFVQNTSLMPMNDPVSLSDNFGPLHSQVGDRKRGKNTENKPVCALCLCVVVVAVFAMGMVGYVWTRRAVSGPNSCWPRQAALRSPSCCSGDRDLVQAAHLASVRIHPCSADTVFDRYQPTDSLHHLLV